MNRTCVKYECCADSDCNSNESCLSNVCIYTPPSITAAEKQMIADRISVLLTNIQVAQQQGRPVASAQQLLSDAKAAYEAGDFATAQTLLSQAQQIFSTERAVTPAIPVLLIVEIVAVVLVFAALVFMRLANNKAKNGKPNKHAKPANTKPANNKIKNDKPK